jgi:hypothetical protein
VIESRCASGFHHVGFFCFQWPGTVVTARKNPMDKLNSTIGGQTAQAARAFEQQRTGNVPRSVTVVLSEETLVSLSLW